MKLFSALLRGIGVILAVGLSVQTASAQSELTKPIADRNDLQSIPTVSAEVFRIWPDGTDVLASQVTLTVFRPQPGRANGTAVVIAPGGAYLGLAGMLEGVEPAAWFTARGVTAFVLTYRTGEAAKLPTPLADGPRAIRFVRSNAQAFAIDPSRIGMLGFSAGGHLAATTTVNAMSGNPAAIDPIERVSDRPDFLILAYPWVEGMLLRADGTSQYCEFALRFGWENCESKNYAEYVPTAAVHSGLPPTFIYHTTDDELVPIGSAIRFYQALVENNVPAEFHAFQNGNHGSGLGQASLALGHWPELLDIWLRNQGLLNSPAP